MDFHFPETEQEACAQVNTGSSILGRFKEEARVGRLEKPWTSVSTISDLIASLVHQLGMGFRDTMFEEKTGEPSQMSASVSTIGASTS